MNWQNIKQRKSQDIISYFYITFISINIFNNKIIPNTTISARSPVHATFNKSKATQYTALVPGILCVLFRLHNKTNSNQVKNLKMNVRLLISFEKAFINDFTILLSPRYWEFSTRKLGKKEPFSHWDWGRYSAPKTKSENHWNLLSFFMFLLFSYWNFEGIGLWCLTPLSTIFHGGLFFFNNCNLLFLFCPCSYKISSYNCKSEKPS
jgi:hypothetical protein